MIKRLLNCRPARLGLGLASLAVATLLPAAEPKITPTKDIIGFTVGDDYVLANYTQLSALLQRWDAESDRMKVVSYGTSEEGRPMYMAIITSPANHANLEKYRDISVKLARARISDD